MKSNYCRYCGFRLIHKDEKKSKHENTHSEVFDREEFIICDNYGELVEK